MTHLKVGGVPEHFNYPWQMALDDGAFAKAHLKVTWQDIPEGTGRMCELLREGSLDLACILTDGLVKDLTKGSTAKIVQGYVQSPLMWGIYTGGNPEVKRLEDIESPHFAVSRIGSGSHVMSYLLADREDWDHRILEHKVVHTLSSAVEELNDENGPNLFLWEKFMTQPLVKKKKLFPLGEIKGDWPSFVIAASSEALQHNAEEIKKMLTIINAYTLRFKAVARISSRIAKAYDLSQEDAVEWLATVRYSQQQISGDEIENILESLVTSNVISEIPQNRDYLMDV